MGILERRMKACLQLFLHLRVLLTMLSFRISKCIKRVNRLLKTYMQTTSRSTFISPFSLIDHGQNCDLLNTAVLKFSTCTQPPIDWPALWKAYTLQGTVVLIKHIPRSCCNRHCFISFRLAKQASSRDRKLLLRKF